MATGGGVFAVAEPYSDAMDQGRAGEAHVFGAGVQAAVAEPVQAEEPEPVAAETGGGIPGYPPGSIILGIVLAVSALWLTQRRR